VSRIVAVDLDRCSAPLHTPFVTALRRTETLESVVVRVVDDEGNVGMGEAPQVWQVTGDSVAGSYAALEGPLGHAVLDAEADPAVTWPLIERAVVGNRSAKAALDAAIHDLPGDRVPATPTVMTVPVGTPDATALAARERVAAGWTALKLKVGTDPALDLDRVRAVRDAVPGATLRLDANQGWDAFTAVEVIRALEDADLRVELVEQPVPAHDVEGLAFVRQRVETPVMADESVFDLHDLVEVVRHDAADLVNLKIAKAGGITPCLELARVARLHGLGVSVGCMLEGYAGVRAAARLAALVGCDVTPDLDGAWWLAEPTDAVYADGLLRFQT
jgi:L-Ala-D/L-Glu epimerase